AAALPPSPLRPAPATHRSGRSAASSPLAQKSPFGAEPPVAARPAERPHDDYVGIGLGDVKPARLAEPPWARLSESRRNRDDRRARLAAHHLELVPFAHRRLVDMAGEDEIRPRVDEGAQDTVPSR